MVKKNLFVLLGKDPQYKKIQIDKIRAFLLKDDPTLTCFSFYCQESDCSTLRQDLENLSFSARTFLFRNSQDMSAEVKEYLTGFLKRKDQKDFFIFDFDLETSQREQLETDAFFAVLFALSPPYKLAGGKKEFSLRDLALALRRNSQAESLSILTSLFERQRAQKIAMQVLGLVVRMFEQVRDPGRRRRALQDIFQADRAIKEGRLDPQTTLEILILRLIKTSSVR
jgi:DNA polymerase III delta subunit